MKSSKFFASSILRLRVAVCVATAAVMAACAAPEASAAPSTTPVPASVAEGLTPQDWVGRFKEHRFLAGSANDVTRVARRDLDPLFRRMQTVCEAEQGQTRVVDADVKFMNVTQAPYAVSLQPVPQFMVCSQQGAPAWGAKLALEKPTWYRHTFLGGGTNFQGIARMSYLDAAQAQTELDRAQREAEAASNEVRLCAERSASAKDELRSSPRIGLEFDGGTVIDVRMPMVEVQFNEIGRKRYGRDREWLRADKLMPRVGC